MLDLPTRGGVAGTLRLREIAMEKCVGVEASKTSHILFAQQMYLLGPPCMTITTELGYKFLRLK